MSNPLLRRDVRREVRLDVEFTHGNVVARGEGASVRRVAAGPCLGNPLGWCSFVGFGMGRALVRSEVLGERGMKAWETCCASVMTTESCGIGRGASYLRHEAIRTSELPQFSQLWHGGHVIHL